MSKSFTVIELDKHRNLRYGYKALLQMEELLGGSLTELDLKKLSLRELAKVAYCGLSHEDAELTIEKTIDVLDFADLNLIVEKISEALNNSFSDGKKK